MTETVNKDFQVTQHFGFFEMTKTSNAGLQELNRQKALEYLPSLSRLCTIMEGVRAAIGEPLVVHSGFRCSDLNKATAGSSKSSQHMLGEACDFTRRYDNGDEQKIEHLFNRTLRYLADTQAPFGQLIREYADRPYGKAVWVHLSLGAPFRNPDRCGEVMTMMAGVDGIPHYTLLKKIA